MYDEDAYNRAIAEFNYFDKIGLYEYSSAWENLEYNLRVFKENYLESSLGGHGNFVTPVLYGDETSALAVLAKAVNLEAKNNDMNKKTAEDRQCKLWGRIKAFVKNVCSYLLRRIMDVPKLLSNGKNQIKSLDD